MSIRFTYFLGFATILVLLLFSLYLQFFEGFIPCPLCTMQRLTFGLLGLLLLTGWMMHAKFWGRLIINTLCTLASLLGLFFAGRQIWLQHFPSTEANECGVSLEYMVEALPLNEVLQKILQGGAECSKRGWEFLYLNMAEWALILFALFLLLSIYLFLKEFRWNHH
jgi:protein dithiol:quinone oxidoreductase